MTAGLKADRQARIQVDPSTGQTGRRAVFAGGDSVNGTDLIVTALADGQRAVKRFTNSRGFQKMGDISGVADHNVH